jgi:CHASE2 domain-containing sensor protein
MSTDLDGRHMSAASTIEHVAAPIDTETAIAALKHGPRGALLLASVSVGLLFIGWLLFYFLLFIPRGPVG